MTDASRPQGGDPSALLAAGDLDAALAAAEDGVRARPADPGAYNALGTVLARRGEVTAAERAFHAVIDLEPDAFRGHSNLSALFRSAGRLEEALIAINDAVARAPAAARLHARRGQIERDLEQYERAVDAFGRAFALEPSPAHRDLYARALFEAGRVEPALEAARLAEPPTRDSVFITATALGALGRKQELEAALERLVAMRPAPAMAIQLTELTAFYNLRELGLQLARAAREGTAPGDPLRDTAVIVEAGYEETLKHVDRALALYAEELDAQRAPSERLYDALLHTCARLALREAFERAAEAAMKTLPRSVRLRATIAAHLIEVDRLDRALEVIEEARAIDDDVAAVRATLAAVHGTAGAFSLARQHVQRALELDPLSDATMRSSLFHALHDDQVSPQAFREAQIAWADRFCVAKRTIDRAPRSLDPERRLKVGYLSGDFRSHAVARFMLPLLVAHDRREVELHLYSTSPTCDRVTEEIRALELTFHDVSAMQPTAIARQIAEDQVDVLVELGGLTGGSSLPTLAHAPAPVQVTYLGYPATTGVPEIDHRLTDPWADPPPLTDSLCVEELVRLPETAWCFKGEEGIDVVERREDGPLVLGSFNRTAKLSDTVLAAWARVLAALPGALLLMKGRGLGSDAVRARITSIFVEHGIDPARISMVGWAPGMREHLMSWGDVDIALDSYPYAGTTTTCEALWMGVPVVTLAGSSHVSRVGVSLLRQVGLDDLVATDWDDYVRRVARLAADAPRRRALRSSLRATMRAAMLGDGARFARDVEAALRAMWRGYVSSPRAQAPSRSRLSRVAPRQLVPPSIAHRETFVAMEQGVERDQADDFARLRYGRAGAHVVFAASPGAAGRALAMARAPGVRVELFEPHGESAALAAPSFELAGLPRESVRERSLAPDDVSRADLVDVDADDLRSLLGRWDPTCPLSIRFASAERAHESAELARGAGLEVLVPLPALGALVRWPEGGALCPLARGFFAAKPGVLADVVVAPHDPDHPLVRAILEQARHPTDLFERALDAALEPAVRLALLHAALADAAREVDADPVGAQLTRARLALELGLRGSLAGALEPLPALEAAPTGRFLPCLGGPGVHLAGALGFARRLSLEALVKWGARSSFDRPTAHRALLVEYFRAGGSDPEMNRRLGLLLALHGTGLSSR